MGCRPNVKVVKHFHKALPYEETEKKTISAGGTWKKINKRGKVKDKKEYFKECASSDSNETLAPRRMIKRRQKASPPPPRPKDKRRGTISNPEEEFNEVIKSDVSETEELN